MAGRRPVPPPRTFAEQVRQREVRLEHLVVAELMPPPRSIRAVGRTGRAEARADSEPRTDRPCGCSHSRRRTRHVARDARADVSLRTTASSFERAGVVGLRALALSARCFSRTASRDSCAELSPGTSRTPMSRAEPRAEAGAWNHEQYSSRFERSKAGRGLSPDSGFNGTRILADSGIQRDADSRGFVLIQEPLRSASREFRRSAL